MSQKNMGRLAQDMKREVIAIIGRLKDPRLEGGLLTVTRLDVTPDLDVAKVSIVGAGMTSNPGVAAKMFEALYNVGININMISTSEIRITVLVKKKDGEKAMNAIHEAFFGNVD